MPFAEPHQPLGDGAFRPMQAGQKYTRCFANSISDHRALLQLEIESSADDLLRNLEQLFGQRYQFFCRQAAMSLIHGLGQCIGDASADPHHGCLLDAELHRDGIGGLETDATDITRQPIRVLRHDLDSVAAIGLENSHRPCRADTVAVQEDHDLPHRLLFGPGGENAGCANRPDAVNLAQPVRRRFNNIEHLLAESAHELLCVDRTNSSDHAGREVLLDAFGGRRGRRAQEPRLELLAVCPIVDPFT